MHKIISLLRNELEQNSDAKTRESAHRYFKEPVKFYGVKTAQVTRIGKKYWQQVKYLPKPEIFNFCEELFKSDYSEEAFIACELTYNLHKQFKPEDFKIFENWIKKYINNWAKCDTFCNHTVGSFIEQFPQFVKNLKSWTKSPNRWVKRAAAVTLILPARHGKFLSDVFEISDNLLLDKDDLVQKGYGWLLKDASIKHLNEIFDYVMKNKNIMPRTALRYAIERMPKELKQKAMAK